MSGATVPELVPRLDRLGDVKVIGLGGVGGIVARYAALYLAALDHGTRLVLIDGDEFEPKNAARMLYSSPGNKAVVVADDLAEHFVDARLSLVPVDEYVTPENLPRLVREGDVVLLAVDNHATRKLVADRCAGLRDVCLISGGNDGVGPDGAGRDQRGTYGNVQVQWRAAGVERTPSLGAFHPEIAEPADKLPTDLSCTAALESVPQILFANLATASAILNAFWLVLCDALHYPELCFDIHDGRMQPLPLPSKLGASRVGGEESATRAL